MNTLTNVLKYCWKL